MTTKNARSNSNSTVNRRETLKYCGSIEASSTEGRKREKTDPWWVGGVDGLELDDGVGEASLVEVEDGVDEVCSADASSTYGLAMEAKGLGSDLADAGELVLCGVDIAADGFGKFAGQVDKVEEVG